MAIESGPGTDFTLFIFDFDHTLIAPNSDLQPFTGIPYAAHLKDEFATLRTAYPGQWTKIMQHQLLALSQLPDYRKSDLMRCIRDVRMEPGLVDTLRELKARGYRMVIASDANTIFIDLILDANGIGPKNAIFDKIYTNPATWSNPDKAANNDTDGCSEDEENQFINLSPYQNPEAPHGCPRKCPVNMCKSTILHQVRRDLGLAPMEMGKSRGRMIYVGDGGNDFCPSLSLGEGDLVLAREGWSLHKLIEEASKGMEETEQSSNDIGHQEDAVDGTIEKQKVERLVAEVKTWKTQENLGRLLLEIMGIENSGDGDDGGRIEKDGSAVKEVTRRIEGGLKL